METKKTSWLFSINTKIIGVILACTASLAAAISVFTFFHLNNVLTSAASSEMNLFCIDKGDEIDTTLISIENSVNALADFTAEEAVTAENLKNSKANRDAVLHDIESLILFMCNQIPTANDAYFHYTIPVTGEGNLEEGCFYARNETGHFEELQITQIQDATAEEDTIWYTTPVNHGKALWMDPHLDGSIQDVMLSYVTPVFCDDDPDNPVAVIGIDISFSKLLKEIDKVKYKNTGYLYLKAYDGSIHYHPGYFLEEHPHGDEADHLLENGYLNESKDTVDKVIRYEYHETDRVMVFVTLRNGMKLVLCDSYEDIFAARNSAIMINIIISVAFAAFFVAVAVALAHRINTPLRHLADGAMKISEDVNAEIDYPKESRDEVGELTSSFKEMVGRIKSHQKLLEKLAYQDSLTKVKNSASYSRATEALEEQIKDGSLKRFGVVMLDVNYLKEVNDNYGHISGDIVLCKVAEIICEAFIDDYVYRIGGDEFVVILEDERTDKIKECLGFMDRLIEHNNETADRAFMKLSVSYGSAVYHSNKDKSYDDVYRRADKRMYEMKNRIHAKRKQR